MQIVRGHLQAYDWGPVDGLTDWTASTGGPQAELWFGSHPNGPSPLRDEGGEATNPLPILTKILAAARPLSIQIHPPAEMARAQYEVQQADPGAPRLLSDPYAKAEILIALEPFVILEGFRAPQRSADVFSHLGPGLRGAQSALAAGDIRGCVRTLLTLPLQEVVSNAEHLPAAFGAAGLTEYEAGVIHDVAHYFPGDPGVFVAALLNARTLQPGEAVFVDPGTVHAYVRGTGVEVMVNSDNVLRLGLTTKTIAVDAALAAMSTGAQPHPLSPPSVDGVAHYDPAGAPFRVDVVSGATCIADQGHARIVVCLEGEAKLGEVVLTPGDGALLAPGDPQVEVEAHGRAVVAHHIGRG